jgi:hypothetical protein
MEREARQQNVKQSTRHEANSVLKKSNASKGQ